MLIGPVAYTAASNWTVTIIRQESLTSKYHIIYPAPYMNTNTHTQKDRNIHHKIVNTQAMDQNTIVQKGKLVRNPSIKEKKTTPNSSGKCKYYVWSVKPMLLVVLRSITEGQAKGTKK